MDFLQAATGRRNREPDLVVCAASEREIARIHTMLRATWNEADSDGTGSEGRSIKRPGGGGGAAANLNGTPVLLSLLRQLVAGGLRQRLDMDASVPGDDPKVSHTFRHEVLGHLAVFSSSCAIWRFH